MKVGIISGSGTEEWPGLSEARQEKIDTPYGTVELTVGRFAGAEVVHLSRHGVSHGRLSNHVSHRANMAGFLEVGVDCLISLTVCGALDPGVTPGSVVVFDDLYFPSNRLPDGSVCTWYTEPERPGRGHWIFDSPFCEPLRQALVSASRTLGLPTLAHGVYGHVDGPRFNTRVEVAALARLGIAAISQTAGPEVVLAGEAGLPMGLVGYVTDYANGIRDEPEPVAELLARVKASTDAFASVVEAALPSLAALPPAGIVHRIEP